ncbi:MAG: hypothetical protein KGV59_03420 [Tenacibaculum sp.]|nr:hypothetical protein [Tenacibaculum sp.]
MEKYKSPTQKLNEILNNITDAILDYTIPVLCTILMVFILYKITKKY